MNRRLRLRQRLLLLLRHRIGSAPAPERERERERERDVAGESEKPVSHSTWLKVREPSCRDWVR